jgi:hypothetical protein
MILLSYQRDMKSPLSATNTQEAVTKTSKALVERILSQMSIAITPESKAAWTKAIEKAKQVKPRVFTLGYGEFNVCGGKGKDCYTVTWTGKKGHAPIATCTCPAGQCHSAESR